LAIPSRRDLELNEFKWWSNWARVKPLGKDAYMLTSEPFREPFFNRACFLECGAVSAHMGKAEREFRRLGLPPTLTVNQSCSSAMKTLDQSGYQTSETMVVMISTGHSRLIGRPDAEIQQVSTELVKEWSQAYLVSFYDDDALMPAVARVVERILRRRSVTLLEARLNGAVAGVLAIFRTPRLAGIYCVGTVPKFRRMGVAGTLLGRAAEIASSEGRRLILQTLKSDGAEDFYKKRGFVELYRKHFMGQES
jgi:GNAT superfamily N-acetyltransferase